ncbi:jg18495 [Pararge aegeria aegeria]|uniref:Jg18495 protein n=1 Tax=Pararge aegeria aegeria TaxID=348720 RepID=A0A8S4RPS4_9NEOP|nr:jg18495 [Pararge aegeria aegeria]
MNSGETNKKKYKRRKHETLVTTRPETSKGESSSNANEAEQPEPKCPLLAKDSEWVDILKTAADSKDEKNNSGEEAIPHLVECEDGAETKPLVLMFPGLLDKYPDMIEGMLNKAMSTSEVTKHLVGQKANFSCMKKVDRLIPSDKKWLESLTEQSTSLCSILSGQTDSILSDYEADTEATDEEEKPFISEKTDLSS